jgi:large-conductance mechanosensitive channel
MLRFTLVAILIFLLIRAFALYNKEEEKRKMRERQKAPSNNKSKISKNVGEFVDYEEIKD